MSNLGAVTAEELGSVLEKLREALAAMSEREQNIVLSLLKQGLLSGDSEESGSDGANLSNAITVLQAMGDLDASAIRGCKPHYTFSY